MTPLFGSDAGWNDSLLLSLATFAIRATVLLGFAWAATRWMRRNSAAARHLVWTMAIAGVLALPLLGAIVPARNVAILSPGAVPEVAPVSAATRVGTPAGRAVVVEAPTPAHVPERSAEMSAQLVVERGTNGTAAGATTAPMFPSISVPAALTLAWLAFAILLLVRLAIANARVSAWQRSSRVVDDDAWQALIRRLSHRYGIERPVVLLENDATDVPVTWGIVYPVVLLPATAREWDEEQRVAVLTHELAHVKRFDALTQFLAQLALALLWFHPLVWLAARRMRLERELACDDFVLVAGARASRYADDLLGLARRLMRPTAPAAAALAMARRSELEGRLLAILDPGAKRGTVRAARVALLAAGALALALPLVAFRPVPRDAARPSIAAREPEKVAEPAAGQPAAPRPSTDSQLAPNVAATADALEALTQRLGDVATSTLSRDRLPSLARVPGDTEPPPRQVDAATLIDVTRAAKRMTNDAEKGQLLDAVAKRYIRNDTLRDAYIETVATMTSDSEKSKALLALLDRDSLPQSSIAAVLRATGVMTSDMNKGLVLRRIAPSLIADSTVHRAYIDAMAAMTSDTERGKTLAALIRQPLSPAVQIAVLRATYPMTSNTEKANILLLFVDRQGLQVEPVRRAFLKSAETLTSDTDYRRVMMAVMK